MASNYIEIDEETGQFSTPRRIHLTKPDGVSTVEIDPDDCCPLDKYTITKEGDDWVAEPQEVNRKISDAPTPKKKASSTKSLDKPAAKRGQPKKK